MNNYNPQGFGYNNSPAWQQSPQYGNYMTPPRLVTNATFVTSLDEALIKTTERNSDMVYFHQDRAEFYRIRVDTEGRKSWAVFQYTQPSQDDSVPATKADLNALLARIEELENTCSTKAQPKKKKDVNENAESNG